MRLGYYRIYKIGREDSVRAALEDFQSAEYYYFYQLKQQCNGAENSLLAAKEGQRIANQKLMEIVQGVQSEARTRLECAIGLPVVGGLFWEEILG